MSSKVFPRTVQQSIIICTTARSRSTLFSDALRLTGKMGDPCEWFNDYLMEEILRRYGLHWHGHPLLQLQAMVDHATTEDGVFSVKAIDEYFFRFLDLLREACAIPEGVSEWDWLQPHLPNPKFILWTRKSKLHQAISFDKAQQGGVWHSATQSKARASSDLLYDGYYIQWIMQGIHEAEQRWRDFLDSTRLPYLELEDSELLEDYSGTVRKVAAYLGLDPEQVSACPEENTRERVSDHINAFWAEQYSAQEALGLPADFNESAEHWSNLTRKLWIEVEEAELSVDATEPVFLRVKVLNQMSERFRLQNSKGPAAIAAIRAQWVDKYNPKRRFPAYDALIPVEYEPNASVPVEIPIASPALAEKHLLYLVLMVRDESWVRMNGINTPEIRFDLGTSEDGDNVELQA